MKNILNGWSQRAFYVKRIGLYVGALVLSVLGSANAQVTVSTDWNSSGSGASAAHYGINTWSGMDPSTAQDATYKSRLSDINPGFIRFHAGEQTIIGNSKSWVNSAGTGWDSTRVNTVLNNITMGGDKMITITGWPAAWQDSNGRLLAARYTDYANFCASLVQIVKNSGKYVKYWEPYNERNPSYVGNGAELGRIFNQCRTAMKAVDSSIQVGGPAWTQPWDNTDFDACLGQIGANIDFVSYHQYGTYTSTNDIQSLYNGTPNFGGGANNVRNKMNFQGQSGKPLILGEYNMFTDWTLDYSGLMRSEKSAVFDALALRSLILSGKADWATSWNDADNTFGKLDPSYNMRQSAFFLRLARQKLVGTSVTSNSTSEPSVTSFAIKNGSSQSLLLICRSNSSQNVNLTFNSGWAPANSSYTVHTISSGGYSTSNATWSGAPQNISMLPHSLKLYEFTGSTGIISGTTYKLTAKHSGKALDVSGFGMGDGANVQQWTYGGGANQKWKLDDMGGGIYRLTSINSGKVLDVSGSSTQNGGNVQQWTDNGSSAQRWKIESAGGGYYKLTAQNSNKVLDVSGFGTGDGVNVQQWDFVGGDNQLWKIELP